jgi:hypothetical protein
LRDFFAAFAHLLTCHRQVAFSCATLVWVLKRSELTGGEGISSPTDIKPFATTRAVLRNSISEKLTTQVDSVHRNTEACFGGQTQEKGFFAHLSLVSGGTNILPFWVRTPGAPIDAPGKSFPSSQCCLKNIGDVLGSSIVALCSLMACGKNEHLL